MAEITSRTIGPDFDGGGEPAVAEEELTIEQQLEREGDLTPELYAVETENSGAEDTGPEPAIQANVYHTRPMIELRAALEFGDVVIAVSPQEAQELIRVLTQALTTPLNSTNG
jgi:hypothetical protein